MFVCVFGLRVIPKSIESVLLLQAASVLILKTLFYSMVELATPECSRLEDCLYYILTQENFKRGDFHSKKSILTIKHLLVLSKKL